MNVKKFFTIVALLGIVLLAVASYVIYSKVLTPNTKFSEKEVFVYIPTNSSYAEAKVIFSEYIKDMDDFEFFASNRNYTSNVLAGKFLLTKNMSNFDLVRTLRRNVPVKLAFNNQETLMNFCGRLSSQLEPDSLQFYQTFTNQKFLEENDFTEETILAMFIPNTYEFYWNITPESLADKLAKEYRKFWTDERKSKAASKNLSPVEVSILAAIVHKESAKVSERPTVAGVYLNRLSLGMPLQADPTVIYAMKLIANNFDQIIKRVYNVDIENAVSPYNTYLNVGLPPGPITMPDINAIDGVLNAPNHDYIYFCASPDNPGYHEFASNYEQHKVNARKYRAWVEKLGIRR